MDDDLAQASGDDTAPRAEYSPPTLTYLGDIADITEKTVGSADGTTFLGLDVGS